MDFNAAIFDLDGTILDSMDVWEHIDIQFLKKRNLPVPENYVTEICARSFEEAAQYTIDLFGLQETVEGIIEKWNNMAVEEYSNHVGLLPHALDYLLRLKEHGIKLAVATGLPEKLYMPCLKNNSILELFDALCSTDEVQRGKEYSDVFELAARKLGVAPEHCIVFDDVLPAIKSAKAARMLAYTGHAEPVQPAEHHHQKKADRSTCQTIQHHRQVSKRKSYQHDTHQCNRRCRTGSQQIQAHDRRQIRQSQLDPRNAQVERYQGLDIAQQKCQRCHHSI